MNGPDITRREDWGANPPRGEFYRMSRYDGFAVHHTVGPQAHEGAEEVRRIQAFHQDGRRWVDIGYNYLIDGGGRIYQGRPMIDGEQARGSHTLHFNRRFIGISLLGCFHPEEAGCNDMPAEEQVDSLVALCRHLMVRHWIRSPVVGGHRDFRNTACPGELLYDRLDEIRERIAGEHTLSLDLPTAP